MRRGSWQRVPSRERERVAAEVQRIDLVRLIGADTKLQRVSRGKGGGSEYHGPCAFCGGTDRFYVQDAAGDDGGAMWRCRRCEKGGDAIAYVRERPQVGYVEALRLLDLPEIPHEPQPQPQRQRQAKGGVTMPAMVEDDIVAPGATWQAFAARLVAYAQQMLWSDEHPRALAYLRSRGLRDDTIRAAGLGYVPTSGGLHVAPQHLGLERDKPVWIPRGFVIPWYVDGELWRVNIRQPAGEPKYQPLPGSPNCVYGIDDVQAGQPLVLVEGEINVLTIRQEAGDLVRVVGLGAATHGRRLRWIARMVPARPVLIATDADEPDAHGVAAGDAAATYWLSALPYGVRWRPVLKDPSEMHQAGLSVRGWVEAGLSYAQQRSAPPAPPVARYTPPTPPAAPREAPQAPAARLEEPPAPTVAQRRRPGLTVQPRGRLYLPGQVEIIEGA